MGEVDTRPRRRDAVLLLAVALVLLAGLVHYGVRLSEQPSATPDDEETSGPARAQARLESGPPADPSQAPSVAGTCWDGRATTSMSLCGLPEGTAGLEWVFPAFSAERPACRPAREPAVGYAVVRSFECFERALGRPVTVTYDHVADLAQARAWLEQSFGLDGRTEIPGAHGGRCLWWDGDHRPVRITGTYARFPYVVSVFAPTRKVAKRAWKTLVLQRPPMAVRGVRV